MWLCSSNYAIISWPHNNELDIEHLHSQAHVTIIDVEDTVRNQREDEAKAPVAKEMECGNQTLGLVSHCLRDQIVDAIGRDGVLV